MDHDPAQALCEAVTLLRKAGSLDDASRAWAAVVKAHEAWATGQGQGAEGEAGALYRIHWRRREDGLGGTMDGSWPLSEAVDVMGTYQAFWGKIEFWTERVED